MPLFGYGGEELYAVKSTLETVVNVVVPIVVGGGTLYALGYSIWKDAKQRDQQRQKLYQDMEKIPPEQQPAVLKLLQDLREGSPTKAAYRIDHLLGKYQP